MFAFVVFARTQFRRSWAAIAPVILLFAITAMMWLSALALEKDDDGLGALFYVAGQVVTWVIVGMLVGFGGPRVSQTRDRVVPPRPDQ